MTPGTNGTVFIGHTDMLRLFEVIFLRINSLEIVYTNMRLNCNFDCQKAIFFNVKFF